MSLLLNIGCGDDIKPGWVNVDSYSGPGVTPDVVADVRRLPFEDCSASHVFLGHMLEHVKWQEVPRALTEVRRVLEPTGQLLVVGPEVMHLTLATPHDVYRRTMFGTQRYRGDVHLWPYSSFAVLLLLELSLQWDGIRHVPMSSPELAWWRVRSPHLPAQSAITAKRGL